MENIVQAMYLWVKNGVVLVFAQTDGVSTQAKAEKYTVSNEAMDDNFLLFTHLTSWPTPRPLWELVSETVPTKHMITHLWISEHR